MFTERALGLLLDVAVWTERLLPPVVAVKRLGAPPVASTPALWLSKLLEKRVGLAACAGTGPGAGQATRVCRATNRMHSRIRRSERKGLALLYRWRGTRGRGGGTRPRCAAANGAHCRRGKRPFAIA